MLPLHQTDIYRAGVPALSESSRLDGVNLGFHLSLLDELSPPSIHHLLDLLH